MDTAEYIRRPRVAGVRLLLTDGQPGLSSLEREEDSAEVVCGDLGLTSHHLTFMPSDQKKAIEVRED
jgi:hypothetical protein